MLATVVGLIFAFLSMLLGEGFAPNLVKFRANLVRRLRVCLGAGVACLATGQTLVLPPLIPNPGATRDPDDPATRALSVRSVCEADSTVDLRRICPRVA